MGRVFLVLMLLVALVLVVVFIASVMTRALDSARQTAQEATLPKTVQNISYGLLIVLMFGVVTGWLGGL